MTHMELIVLVLASEILLLTCWVGSIHFKVKNALSYPYLELLVEDAIDGWLWRRTEDGIDITETMEEIAASDITEDVLLIAWKYSEGSFEDRIREATEDLLDASFPYEGSQI